MSGLLSIGIDPGRSGGVAVIEDEREYATTLGKNLVPATLPDWITSQTTLSQRSIAAVELLTGFVGNKRGKKPRPDGKFGDTGSSQFKMGTSYGAVQMALVASGFKLSKTVKVGCYVLVSPSVWQRELRIDPRREGETDPEWKGRLQWNAERMYPDVKLTLATCDALLIATWVRKKYLGLI